MTKKIVTNEDLIKLLSKERQKRIKQEVEEIVKTHGGMRENAGRKTLVKGTILKFTKRLTAKEAQFIDYARSHELNLNDLMQG